MTKPYRAQLALSALAISALSGFLILPSAAGAAPSSRSAAGSTSVATAAGQTVLAKAAPGLSPSVLAMALRAAECAEARGVTPASDVLTVIDYSLPSTQQRLWVLDRATGKLLFRDLVAHGVGSGDNRATRFSNVEGSRQTSLGLFLTGDTYQGGNGYSLKLHGLEPGTNDRALERTIVIHGAWYVSPEHARQHGRIGRSWGCPALPVDHAKPMIDAIKGGTLVFAYYPDAGWLGSSKYLTGCSAPPHSDATTTVAAGAGR